MKEFIPKKLPLKLELSRALQKKLIEASRKLSELNGIAKIIPNQEILINALILQEAKDSNEIENIITTHDELFLAQVKNEKNLLAVKEVQNYEYALKKGFKLILKEGLLRNTHILKIQECLEANQAGFRKQAGTTLKNLQGEIKHTPPQSYDLIVDLMSNLEAYINDDELEELDYLVKMAIIHYQFESIHPFYDGNGRTGRILNILYLVYKKLLDLPILYLSGYIVKSKQEYYDLLQKVRDENAWEEWIGYMLEGVLQISIKTINVIRQIDKIMNEYKKIVQEKEAAIYSKDFIEALFMHPYTKIDYIANHLNITRQTAAKYLNSCEKLGILMSVKLGRNKYYVNTKLFDLFLQGIC